MERIFYFSTFLFLLDQSHLYAQSAWSQKKDLNIARATGVGFSIAYKGYVGTGGNPNTGIAKDFWEYDPSTNVWTQKADLGGEERQFAVGFAIGEYGYIGTGNGGDSFDDFWQYDPVSNTWTEKAKYPGGKRMWAVGFSIGDKGYIGTGTNQGSEFRKDFYEYDPATDTWTQKANVGGEKRAEAVGFSIGNKGYIGTGAVETTGFTNDFWEYDPETDTWIEKAAFPGEGINAAVGFGIGNKGYIGTGLKLVGGPVNSFWEYDQPTDTWTEKDTVPASERQYAVGFALNGKGYIGTGVRGNVYFKDFYEYTPENCAVPANLTSTNISPSSAKLKWEAAAGATKYKVQHKADSAGAPWISKVINAVNTSVTITNLAPGTTYKWKVRSVCGNEHSEYSAAAFFTTALKLEHASDGEIFFEVYPNPLTSHATVSFSLSEASEVRLEVFNLTGKRVMVLNQVMESGDHELELQREQIGEGQFLIRLITGHATSVLRMMVL
ncbi:MAG: fibronectin type III domain-containing protein [Bacteroidetes bacterium]|nr:fibronectin type III domain-containing protein [Bacteroidota bacterium]